MIRRAIELHNSNSLFLFGARGTGKSTLLRKEFGAHSKLLWIDLLKDDDEELYSRHPGELEKIVKGGDYQLIVINEVQKAPKLLDVVHRLIEDNKHLRFILTGSSARKLKRGGANLLAGRAFSNALFPFTFSELGELFVLDDVLKFGTLPQLYSYKNNEDKIEYLKSYARTYLREEVQIEQLVRNLNPFRDFLEIAAQSNSEIINYSKMARQVEWMIKPSVTTNRCQHLFV